MYIKVKLNISRAIATLNPPLRWYWYVFIYQRHRPKAGHPYFIDKIGYKNPVTCFLGFLRHGLKHYIKAWRI
jgi:hypothetical protein